MNIKIDYLHPVSDKEKIEDIEANYFTVGIKIPTYKFLEIFKKTQNIKLIAKYFGVSESVILYKLNILKSRI